MNKYLIIAVVGLLLTALATTFVEPEWYPATLNGYSIVHGVMAINVAIDAPFTKETKVVAKVTLILESKKRGMAVLYDLYDSTATFTFMRDLYDPTATLTPKKRKYGRLALFGASPAGQWLKPPDNMVGPDDMESFWRAISAVEIKKL